MKKLFSGNRIYITLNVIMLIITVLTLVDYGLAWLGFIISCLYVAALTAIWPIILIINIITFILAFSERPASVIVSMFMGFIGGFIGSFFTDDDDISRSLRCIFIVMLWITVIIPGANILLHQFDVLPMLM